MTAGKLPAGWRLARAGRAIRRAYVLEDFAAAAALIARIARAAKAADHHPDLRLTRYRRLEVELTTRSAGGLTVRDRRLAARIESLPRRDAASGR
jgi:4a-hydroxytetrahydrobiopterin dehydratase